MKIGKMYKSTNLFGLSLFRKVPTSERAQIELNTEIGQN